MITKRFLTLMFAATLAGSAAMAQEATNPWPWDFPQNVKLNAEPGQTALSCQSLYSSALKKNEDLTKSVLIWYNTTIEKVGAEKSTVKKFGEAVEIPNALLVPIAKGQKAKKGDILLTWWQSGSGMERAIVVDDSNPTSPTAVYLDLNWPDNPDDPKTADKSKGEQLKPNTFNVLKDGGWQAGAQVAYRSGSDWKWGILVQMEGDKVLLSTFSSKLETARKSDCQLIPFKEKIKKGDQVWVVWLTGYRYGYTVEKVDERSGHVYVKKNGSSRIECKSIAQVTKVLK